MAGKIKSDNFKASEAVAELIDLDTSGVQNQQVEFSYTSEIGGMESGRQTTNQMLTALGDFSQAVLLQANKFPQIAAKLEKRDLDIAQRWEKKEWLETKVQKNEEN